MIGEMAKKNSIIESFTKMEDRKQRKDRRGKVIVKGGKSHRISFKDQVCPGERLATVTIVESYKQYNVDVSLSSNTGCGCRVL